MSNEILPKTHANREMVRLVEALPFLETAKSDLLEGIESHDHEQGVQNVEGSHVHHYH